MPRNFLPRFVLTFASHGGVVTLDVSFSVLSVSSCLVCFWIVCKLKIVSAFIDCFLVGGDGCIEDFFAG